MDRPRTTAPDPALSTLEHEFNLVRSAIAMVSSGASSRVLVCGLRYGEELLETARRTAAQQGVRIVPLWTGDETGADIRVERSGDE